MLEHCLIFLSPFYRLAIICIGTAELQQFFHDHIHYTNRRRLVEKQILVPKRRRNIDDRRYIRSKWLHTIVATFWYFCTIVDVPSTINRRRRLYMIDTCDKFIGSIHTIVGLLFIYYFKQMVLLQYDNKNGVLNFFQEN